ncbi:MAG: transglycosylase SLT domain-containing protein, partial [Methylobacteriaceae bacterium]|nr:transglycosylase SLT domain-containing protein [Methylobacteriaceae bacterium]
LARAVDAPPAAAGSGQAGAASPPVPINVDATAAFADPAGAQAGDASVGGKTQLAYAEPTPESAKPEASAPATPLPSESGLPVPETPPGPRVDTAGLDQIIALYRKGDLAGGDALAKARTDPLVHTTLEWLALRTNPHDAGYQRIMDFLAAHRDWPGAAWLRRHAEEALFFDKRDASVVAAFFGDSKPIGPLGQLAEARVLLKDGRQAEAAAIVREVWRDNDLGLPAESAILREFAGLLTAADHKFRADRLIYEESTTAALRAAERAGTDVAQLARARAAAVNASATAGALLDAVPVALRKDPGYQFARIQLLRRAGRTAEAAAMLLAAPREPELIVDGDAWWNERRWIARKLLDLGDAETAYRLCAEHSAVSPEAKVEAEFHAGWIALRYLDDPARASTHFARAAAAANGPDTKARAAYWQGRAAEASGDRDGAMRFYAAAAAYPANYYGQLANAKLPAEDVPVRRTPTAAIDDDRHEAVKVIELLYALGQPDLAMPLIIDAVQNLSDETQVAAVGAVVSAYHDARATLLVGKFAANRGLALDQFAFPIFGIPAFEPVANSADRAVIYAIARQESAFEPRAVSGAGAKGLMQLLSSTARRTAQRFGIAYDEARLTSDAAFNAKLGAAFLGALFGEQRGSYILTFAAYNAGGKRVQEWINAYGDPLNPAIDPVDWIELIPIDETRHYVQLIMENLEMYRLRFGDRSALLIDADLRRSGSGS